ncbi:MAG: ATP-dependent RecD-like DNA helicase [Acholeplasmatales bacterium]|nr:MAG: ATP-dependent RecD-like DNA helicase [Acholeplasmatales bacterium]
MNSIEGHVRFITYYNEENRYAIVKVVVTTANFSEGLFAVPEGTLMTVTGYFPRPAKGETVRFYGNIVRHPTYGEQFEAKSMEKVGETTEAGIIEYLSSDLFPGIGPKTAERVVATLGRETIKKVLSSPQALDEVTPLSPAAKQVIVTGLSRYKAEEHILIQLYGYGISAKIAMRLIDRYRHDTMRVLQENPYRLIDEVDGVGFDRADDIGRKLGFASDHPHRIKAVIQYLFRHLVLNFGHTLIDYETFVDAVLKRLNKDVPDLVRDTIVEHIESLIQANRLIRHADDLTLASIAYAEKTIASKLAILNQAPQATDKGKIETLIAAFEKAEHIRYSAKQKEAIHRAMSQRMMIVTGGPGTGKTTVIKGLVKVYHRYHNLEEPTPERRTLIHLVAPTGRAAKRMQESTGYYATTIHRLLGYSYDGSFQHNRSHLLEGNLFIVDEASMIDVFLAAQLLESLPDYANVVFVGDDAQLPSVGPGQVFKDLIEAGILPVTTLDIIHRQAKDSHIVHLASHIRDGKLPSDMDVSYPDRYVFNEQPERFQGRLKRIIDYLVKQGHDLHDDIQVLIPMYKGATGIDETNRFLQATYNKTPGPEVSQGDRTFRKNDKVLQLVNQIEDGVMNGDQGRVVEIDADNRTMTVDFFGQIVTYKSQDFINLTHAYAMSVHKSQGSEYNVVIMPVFGAYAHMLKRKLIYTGITRAKQCLVLFGQPERLQYAVKHLEEDRKTRLKDALISMRKPSLLEDTAASPPAEGPMVIADPDIPFDTLGENLQGATPYDFLD